MAEMDPIIRDALKRSSQMQGYGTRQQQTTHKKQEKPEPKPAPKEEPAKKPEQSFRVPETNINTTNNTLNMLFKDKEQSLILLLVVLLMNEDSDPMLLLALMYLLI